MEKVEKVIVGLFIVLMLPVSVTLYFCLEKNQVLGQQISSVSGASLAKPALAVKNDLPKKLENPPEIIKAIYLTAWSAGSKKYVDGYLSDIFKNTEINAVVIDIKDYTGYVSYNSKAPEVVKYKTSKNIISDLSGLIKKLHEKNIYAIARISTFEDPAFAAARPDLAVYDKTKTADPKNPILWQDNNGLYWLDPSSTEAQDYNISIAKDALANGFDEVNFDYIRFPSDGKTSNMELPFYDGKTPRHTIIKNFFTRIRNALPNDKISADLFGQATVNYDDLGIGQIIEDSFEYFDYVCPMIYPSHYIAGFLNLENPAQWPYDVVKYSMETAIERQIAYGKTSEKTNLAKIRPWLQDFNMGAVYTADMVKEQITATQEATSENYAGYLMWNPSNVYKQEALVEEAVFIKE